MRREVIIPLLILLTLSTIPIALGDYNITCERDCIAFENISCGSTIDFIGDQDSIIWNNPTWNEEWNTNWSHKMSFTYLPSEQNNSISCSLNLVNTYNVSAGSCVIKVTPFVVEVLNSSDTYYDGGHCLPAGSGYLNNDRCFENRSTKNFEFIRYSSTDGSCTGTQEYYNWGDPYGCLYEYNLNSASNDIYYRFNHWNNVGTQTGCYKYYDQFCGIFQSGTGSQSIWNMNCTLPCGTNDQFAWVMTLNNSVGGLVNKTGYYYFNQTAVREDCVSGLHFCSQYGTPYNDTLEYSCECPPSETETYFSCADDTCTKTCSGTSPTPTDNETIGIIFSTDDPLQMLELQKGWMNDIMSFVGMNFMQKMRDVIFIVSFIVFIGLLFSWK